MSTSYPLAPGSPIHDRGLLSGAEGQPRRQAPAREVRDLFASLGGQANLQGMVQQLPGALVKIFNAESCLITLADEVRGTTPTMEPDALPMAAEELGRQSSKGDRAVIIEHILASGESLLIKSTKKWDGAEKTGQLGDAHRSMMFSPILAGNQVLGVVNVNGPHHKRCFDQEDLDLLDAIALCLAQSIQVLRLQDLLDSRLVKLALAQSIEKTTDQVRMGSVSHLDKMTRIVAKSFYREMAKAGFSSKQIISAATEIISELNNSLQRHSKRLNKS